MYRKEIGRIPGSRKRHQRPVIYLEVPTSSSVLTAEARNSSPTRLPLPRDFYSSHKTRRRDIERVANQEQGAKRRRLQVPFELADIGARQTGPERRPVLGKCYCSPNYIQSSVTYWTSASRDQFARPNTCVMLTGLREWCDESRGAVCLKIAVVAPVNIRQHSKQGLASVQCVKGEYAIRINVNWYVEQQVTANPQCKA
jgi:hypothetical protein